MSHADSVKKALADSIEKVIKSADRLVNDASRFIAGMDLDTASKLYSLTKTDDWKQYKTTFDSAWKILDTGRMSPQRKWTAEELKIPNTNGLDLWYPFSGPDFLNAYLHFPNAKNYYFVALEPPGELPQLEKMKDKEMKSYLSHVFKALNDLMNKSYFITSYMGGDLQKGKANGTVPIICLFMARMDCQVLKVETIDIDNDGKVIIPKTAAESVHKNPIKGVRIDFVPSDKREIRSLYYWSVNVHDTEIKTGPEFTKYVASLGKVNTYIKAASYLMHADDFKVMRDMTLSQSEVLLQDDTGIAYRFFNASEWKITLFGKYAKPVKNFPWINEPDLAKAFKDSTVKPLPFHIGYHWQTLEDNQILAMKIKK